MANKIIDVSATTVDYATDNTNTETVVITSNPTRVGTVARISFSNDSNIDSTMTIRRGAGTGGTALWTHTVTGTATMTVVDNSPVSQYTLTNTDDSSYSMTVTFSVEQIA